MEDLLVINANDLFKEDLVLKGGNSFVMPEEKDVDYLEGLIKKIYSINCEETKSCIECKNGLKWCPKEYADELSEGLKLIRLNVDYCESIVKSKRL